MKAEKFQRILSLSFLAAFTSVSFAQGTAFNYNGELISSGAPANGSYDFQFAIYGTSSGGSAIAGPTVVSTGVTNGLFLVTLDFGSGVFTGADRWLDIGVRTNGASSFTPMGPRQKFTASPYAIYSGQAANASAVADSSVGSTQLATPGSPNSGQVLSYNGSSLVWANPAGLGWSLTGNSGTTPGVNFLGTTDNQPLELRVQNVRALRLERAGNIFGSSSVNVIGGFSGNSVSGGVLGATIAGGGYGSLSGDSPNTVSANYGSIGGGAANLVSGLSATIPGGTANVASGMNSFAAGTAAYANYDGSFVWGDGSGTAYSSGPNCWDVLATGGVNFNTGVQPFTLYGPWLVANGLGGEQAYIGGDGIGNDVQIGSLNSTVTEVYIWNAASSCHMNLHVATLTINGGCDLAEPFELSADNIPKGAVVIIDDERPGRLKMSGCAYDTRVAGVVSGADGIRPGIMMHQQGLMDGNENVALSGRVYVLADAGAGEIKPGDLLTTSSLPGYAMKVTDHARAQGAILGKAMSGLNKGRGNVLMLVTLQ